MMAIAVLICMCMNFSRVRDPIIPFSYNVLANTNIHHHLYDSDMLYAFTRVLHETLSFKRQIGIDGISCGLHTLTTDATKNRKGYKVR